MKKIISFFKKLFEKEKLVYVTPGYVLVNSEEKARYSFSDSWCYASESK